jgi:hypothetical protein
MQANVSFLVVFAPDQSYDTFLDKRVTDDHAPPPQLPTRGPKYTFQAEYTGERAFSTR